MEPRNENENRFEVMNLEERIAPTATGNPGNNNPGQNNTNNPGNQPPNGNSNHCRRPAASARSCSYLCPTERGQDRERIADRREHLTTRVALRCGRQLNGTGRGRSRKGQVVK